VEQRQKKKNGEAKPARSLAEKKQAHIIKQISEIEHILPEFLRKELATSEVTSVSGLLQQRKEAALKA
jgi:hypothetical protein